MTKKTENGSQHLSISASDKIVVSEPIAAIASPINVKVTTFKKEPFELNYDPATPSGEIIKDSLNASGMNLLEFYVEKVTETFERSRSLVDGGGKLSIILPDFLDGGSLEFERLPKSTTKTTNNNMFRATIICPKCKIEKNLDVTDFKDSHKRLETKCKCGEVFQITLEFRKHPRKNALFAGEYFVQEKDEMDYILIKDISMNGVNFSTVRPNNFSMGDTVELKFTIDNPMRTEIQTPIEVKWIIDNNVGGQFFDPRSLEKDLMPYLNA